MHVFPSTYLVSWIGLVFFLQIEKEDIVYQTGNKKKLKDSVKVELYPPFLTMYQTCLLYTSDAADE